jgi:flagellin
MPLSIQTNVNSLIAQENLRVNNAFQSQTIQRLTSGYRINSSGDDAAGLAVANKFRNSIAELTQGVANGNDAVASLQIMDGGIGNISKMLDRLKTLAMQSASSSFTGDRATLNSEFQSDIAEIDRQAQSIGLNTGGTFAKNLTVYLGAGNGSQSTANSIVNVDLSRATVDAQSLGLKGVQAVNSANYDLGGSSATSVHAILNDAVNAGSLSSPAATTSFTFYGAGFSNADGTTGNGGVTINVNLNGVGDTASLVDAINAAIQVQAQQPTAQSAAFAAADIKASIVTDSNGNQKLAFSSDSSAFQVAADDRTANALMGNFAADGTSAATGAVSGATITARAAANQAAMDFSTNNVTLTISGDGLSSPVNVTLNANYSNLGSFANLNAVAADIQTLVRTATGDAGFAVANNAGTLTFSGSKGAITVSASSSAAANVAALGMDASGTSAGTSVLTGPVNTTYFSNGAYEMASTSSGSAQVSNFQWAGAPGASGQTISIAANDANGVSHPISINLTASENTIDKAVGKINDALQKSNDATLKQITAVVVDDHGVQKINFISTVSSFSVAVGNEATSKGITDGAGNQGTSTQAQQIGTGGSADISTIQGAQAAVAAISKAVLALGKAQASIGKGENQLNYAISLAQSQITNFSAAEAQIRDADVASEAANLTKAQVLQQASIAAMAQANSAPQAVLALLRG